MVDLAVFVFTGILSFSSKSPLINISRSTSELTSSSSDSYESFNDVGDGAREEAGVAGADIGLGKSNVAPIRSSVIISGCIRCNASCLAFR